MDEVLLQMNDLMLSKDLEQRVDFCVRYGTSFDIDCCLMQLKDERARTLKKKGLFEDRKKMNARFKAYIYWVERQYPRFANSRCPDCGTKLETRRCLACDLKSGLT